MTFWEDLVLTPQVKSYASVELSMEIIMGVKHSGPRERI